MLQKLMRALFALLVAVAFGCMPTLALASDATASPPVLEVALAPEEAPALVESQCASPNPLPDGDAVLVMTRTSEATPSHPLRE